MSVKEAALVTEPILQPNDNRFVIFPIQHDDLWEWYKNSKPVFGLQKKLIYQKMFWIGIINCQKTSVILSSIF